MKEREYTVIIKDIQNRINHLKKEIKNNTFDNIEILQKKNKLKKNYDKRDEAFRMILLLKSAFSAIDNIFENEIKMAEIIRTRWCSNCCYSKVKNPLNDNLSGLIVASLLYQYWDTINKWLRTYLAIATVVLVLITSMGIYGFLSAAYQETYSKLEQLRCQQAS